MTQAQDIPTWCLNFQLKLMAALDAAWKSIETTHDPAAIRQARDKVKAIGDLAAMVDAVAAGLHPAQGVANLSAMVMDTRRPPAPELAPVAAQAEHARRALDKLKGGRRGRL